MLGAIAGDVIGSVHEFIGTKTTNFPLFDRESRFTDDTVLAVAVADCLLNGLDYVDTFHRYAAAYPDAGYGLRFAGWVRSGAREPYNSWGNGSAMRVAAVAYAFDSMTDVLAEAARSATVTHSHPEGIKGAQATAAAVFLALTGRASPTSANRLSGCSATTSARPSTISGRPTSSTSRVSWTTAFATSFSGSIDATA